MRKMGPLLILVVFISACSFPHSTKEEVTMRPSDELEFVVADTLDEKIPDGQVPSVEVRPEEKSLVVEGQGKPDLGKEETVLGNEPKMEDFKTSMAESPSPKEEAAKGPAEEAPVISEAPKREMATVSNGAEASYQMQKGDTLMMVAFKIYGDYRKWKDLAAWNPGIMKKKDRAGTELKYYVPERSFGWQPSGVPYLIKTGDNLGMISMDKYGTSKKWKVIYENNRPLIRNPNLIFAGFTIYYVPARDVASENR